MLQFLRTLFLTAVACLLLATGARAAQIIVSGSIEGTEVFDWRTAGTPKTMDLDGDGIYGTLGALNWLPELHGSQVQGSSVLGWAPASWGFNSNSPDYRGIDSIPNAPTDVNAGYAEDYFTFELTGVETDFLGKTVRVGVMQDILDSASLAEDRCIGLQLVQTFGGTGTSPIFGIRFAQGGNGAPEMYFWDLTGVKPGDQFTLYAFNNFGGIGFHRGYVGPVSFDIAPEPGSATLALAGAVALLARRRHSR